MPIITIVGCRMFEDEMLSLIEKDKELDEVILVENEGYHGLDKKLTDIGYPHKVLTVEEIISFPKNSEKYTLIVDIVQFGLEASPSALKDKVYERIGQFLDHCDLILLLYGLCGNVLGKVEEDFGSHPCKVRILKEGDGEIVDDCIGALLGGRKKYLETLKTFKGEGVYFLTPMGAANWRELLQSSGLVPDSDDLEMTKFVFDYSGYNKVAKVDTGLCYEKNFNGDVEEFAKCFDFDIIEIKGNTKLIEKCYGRAKAELMKSK